jgi:hypothetical protein
MKAVEVTISGISPLLMHAFPMIPIEALEKKSPEEQCKYAEYRTSDSKLYIPAINLQRALVSAASYSKGKGRASLQKIVAACVLVSPEHLILSTQTYAIDARPVVIPSTKGRVLRYRPRLDTWSVTFEIEFDDNLLTENQLRRVVDDCGSRVGLLDFRPEHRGPFGRFSVISWNASVTLPRHLEGGGGNDCRVQ